MSLATECIADLDAALLAAGETIILRSPTNIDVTCRAGVRSPSAKELAAGFTQTDSIVILSSTEINAAVWPSAQTPGAADVRVPSKDRGDTCVIQAKVRSVESANPIYIGADLVRLELRVLG